MSALQFGLEEVSNAVSTFGGLYGAAWGVGWESDYHDSWL